MALKQTVDKALKTPMTRKEFLGQVGALFLAVVGVSSILHALGNATVSHQVSRKPSVSEGYGSSVYGG